MQNQQQIMQKQHEMIRQKMMADAKNSPWFIQEADLQRFTKIFAHFDSESKGFLTGPQMREVMD
jgi:hypothetical protein